MGKIEERPGQVTFKTAWIDFFKGYVDFKGRSTRAGYWWIRLVTYLLGILAFVLMLWPILSIIVFGNIDLAHITKEQEEEIVKSILKIIVPLLASLVVSLVLFLPSLALSVRRLRDVGLRGRGQVVLYLLLLGTNWFQASKALDATDFYINISSTTIGVVVFILTLLPTGAIATRSQNTFIRFFLKDRATFEEEKKHAE